MDNLKQRLVKMKENAFCFVHLIADYVRSAIKGKHVLIPLERHLRVCSKCAKEKQNYENFLASTTDTGAAEDTLEGLPAAAAFMEAVARADQLPEDKPRIKEGQIWSTPGFPNYLLYQYEVEEKELPYSLEPRPFLIYRYDNGTGTALGFPINPGYLEFASDFDLIAAADETELGFEFMIETWNPVSTSSEFLQEYWGAVPAEIMKKVDALAREFNGEEAQETLPGNIVTGKPIHFAKDIRRQFQEAEQRITQYISAPFLEKKELETFKDQYTAKKILETMILYSVVHLHRHKDFLPVASDESGNLLYIYSKEQPIFDHNFTLNITINEMEKEYLLHLHIVDNKTGEETRGFVVDMLKWKGNFPETKEELKAAYLLFKKNEVNITHIRLWEKGERLAIPTGKNIILAVYKAGNPRQVEFIPILLSSE